MAHTSPSAILTTLQFPFAAANPLTRYSAFLSLVCDFMSLLYGCIYILRFGSMRTISKAAEWANVNDPICCKQSLTSHTYLHPSRNQNRNQLQYFGTYGSYSQCQASGLLGTCCLSLLIHATAPTSSRRSMISYIVCIMTIVWQSGVVGEPDQPSQSFAATLAPRIVVTAFFALGLVYLTLIGLTFKQYGEDMENTWCNRVEKWVREKAALIASIYSGYPPPTGTFLPCDPSIYQYCPPPPQPGVPPSNIVPEHVPSPSFATKGTPPSRSSSSSTETSSTPSKGRPQPSFPLHRARVVP